MSDEERQPPQKIRITKLQEAQVIDLARIEAHCAEMFYEVGLDGAQVEPRGEVEIARLTRDHDLLVAEADHHVAGYLGWADEAPGVGWIPILMVAPAYQRFGVGTRLLRELGERAHGLGIEQVVTSAWDAAPWAQKFLGARGFQRVESVAQLPEKLRDWAERRGPEVSQPGQKLWWSKSDGLGTIPGLPRPD
jgi:N-acetylglutamate synthase-like GNAT family acetyltransferase